MKKIILYSLMLFFAGMTIQSCKDGDKKIQDSVNEALKNKYSTVSATVKDKVVTLTGTLQSQTERSSAESVVRSVKNVQSVVNNITVQEPTPITREDTDSIIKSSLTAQFEAAGYNDVKVDVTNGEVILSGEVKRSDLQKVMQIANETTDVKKVTNNITSK